MSESSNPYLILPSAIPDLVQERLKLNFLKQNEEALKKKLSLDIALAKAETKIPRYKRLIYRLTYSFLLLFGLIEQASGSYIFALALFGIIPGISRPLLIGLSIIFTVLDAILFFAFEVSFLKSALKGTLGFPLSETKANSFIDAYLEQLTLATSLNAILSSTHALTLDVEELDHYLKLSALINKDLLEKQKKFGSYQESLPKKILKWGVIIFGALSSIAGSYFMAISLLAAISASLIGTPLGWALIALTIIAGLGFYASMNAKGMSELINPNKLKFNELKKDFSTFKPKSEADIAAIMSLRQSLIKKPVASASTQTECVEEPVIHPPVLAQVKAVNVPYNDVVQVAQPTL